MPIIRSHNGNVFRFEADLSYSDLPNNTVNCQIVYGTFDPEFFIDINNSAVKTLIENKDERLFEFLAKLNREAEQVLERQLAEDEIESAKQITTKKPVNKFV